MITIHNYEDFALDYIEGELAAAEMAEMEVLLSQNPALRAEFATLAQNWSTLFLEADETVVYTDANKLLHPLSPVLGLASAAPTAARIPVFRYARIAAVAVGILLFGSALYQIMPNISQNDPENGFAQSNKINDKISDTVAKTQIAAAEKMVFDTKKTAVKTEIIPPETQPVADIILSNKRDKRGDIENKVKTNFQNDFQNDFQNGTNNSQNFANNSIPNKPTNAADTENKSAETHSNNDIAIINPQNTAQNQNAAPPQRAILASTGALPTANITDFYFETDDTPQRIFMLSQNKNYLVSTQTLKKRRQPLEAFLPEGSTKGEREGSIWKAFLPESAKENSVNFAAIAETFRPSR